MNSTTPRSASLRVALFILALILFVLAALDYPPALHGHAGWWGLACLAGGCLV